LPDDRRAATDTFPIPLDEQAAEVELGSPDKLDTNLEPMPQASPKMESHRVTPPELTKPASPQWIQHAIVDGDSLHSLAERYFSDAARAMEIYSANRQVLENPEILPLNAVLRIPVGDSTPASQQQSEAPKAQRAPSPMRLDGQPSQTDKGLVPLNHRELMLLKARNLESSQ
jgi:hypothetical protein